MTFYLIISLVLAAALVASVFSYVPVQNERDRFERELDVRASTSAAEDVEEESIDASRSCVRTFHYQLEACCLFEDFTNEV
jgi:hypothetical protein